MKVIEQDVEAVSEALKTAHQCWSGYYKATQSDRFKNLLAWNPQRSLIGNLIRGAGSVIALYPATYFEANDFRCWHWSMDDAWHDDWYNVGGDLYQALSNIQVGVIHVESSENESPTPAAT